MRIEIMWAESPSNSELSVPILAIRNGNHTPKLFRLGWDRPTEIFGAAQEAAPAFLCSDIQVKDGEERCMNISNPLRYGIPSSKFIDPCLLSPHAPFGVTI